MEESIYRFLTINCLAVRSGVKLQIIYKEMVE
jgi:hypothetical protein